MKMNQVKILNNPDKDVLKGLNDILFEYFNVPLNLRTVFDIEHRLSEYFYSRTGINLRFKTFFDTGDRSLSLDIPEHPYFEENYPEYFI